MSVATKEQIAREIWRNNYGTENYYQYLLLGFKPIYNYTDGVKQVADQLGAYWLLDIVGSIVPKLRKQEFNVIKLIVENKKAVFKVTNGGNTKVYTQRICYTDFPEGEWKFYYQNDVFFLSSEY